MKQNNICFIFKKILNYIKNSVPKYKTYETKYIAPFPLFISFLGGIIGNNDSKIVLNINIIISKLYALL